MIIFKIDVGTALELYTYELMHPAAIKRHQVAFIPLGTAMFGQSTAILSGTLLT